MNMEIARRFAEATRRYEEKERELEAIGDEVQALDEALQAEMLADAVKRVSIEVDGEPVTLSLGTTLWPKMRDGVDRDKVIEALRACEETADMVAPNYNQQTFAAWCRERVEQEKLELPPEIAAVVELAPRRSVGMRSDSSGGIKNTKGRSASGANPKK